MRERPIGMGPNGEGAKKISIGLCCVAFHIEVPCMALLPICFNIFSQYSNFLDRGVPRARWKLIVSNRLGMDFWMEPYVFLFFLAQATSTIAEYTKESRLYITTDKNWPAGWLGTQSQKMENNASARVPLFRQSFDFGFGSSGFDGCQLKMSWQVV